MVPSAVDSAPPPFTLIWFPADTDNGLASGDGGYENITVPYRPGQPTVELLQYLTTQVKPGNVPVDCILNLILLLHLLPVQSCLFGLTPSKPALFGLTPTKPALLHLLLVQSCVFGLINSFIASSPHLYILMPSIHMPCLHYVLRSTPSYWLQSTVP